MAGIGEALRSTRERRGLSIDEVARDTRISPRFLEALESEQFDELPAPVYVRGFIRSYAGYLRLEPQPLLDQLVGGGTAATRPTTGYVGGTRKPDESNGTRRRSDPFQRSGVVVAPAAPIGPVDVETSSVIAAAAESDSDAWSPEPPAPFSPDTVSHAYIPGSDLMEAPEYPELQAYPETEPVFRPRTPGVLAERPPSPGEPGVPRKVAVLAGAVFALLGMLLLAVFLTRGDGDGTTTNAAATNATVELTPGSVIPIGSKTPSPAASASPATSPSATTSASPSATTSTTPTPGTATPLPTSGAGTATPTATPTVAETAVPTATPTVKLPTPTIVVIRAENNGFGECIPTNGSFDCGAPPYRVICYTPLGFPQNQNWWVDADRSFGTLPAGWKQFEGLANNAAIINAGQSLCAVQ